MRDLTLRSRYVPSLFHMLPAWLTRLLLYRDKLRTETATLEKIMTIDEVAAIQDYAGRYPFANCGC